MRTPWSRSAHLAPLSLLAFAAAAVWLRAGQFARLPPADRGLLIDPDGLYHLRLARLTLRGFPSPPSHDPYLNFPLGAEVPWPFLQDWLAAGAALLTGRGETALPAVAFWYPVAMALFALPLAYLLARALTFPPWAAAAAAGLASLVPAQVSYSLAGRFDHHAGDLVFSLLFFLAAAAVWRSRGDPASRALPAAGALALASAAMALNWLGAVFYLAVLAVAALALAPGGADPRLPAFLSRTGWSLAAGGAILGGLTAWACGTASLAGSAMDKPSGFQPLLFLGAGFLLAAAGRWAREGKAAFRRGAFLLCLAAAAGALLLAAPQAWKGAGTYLFGADRGVGSGILEFQSPFLAPGADPLSPRWSLGRGLGYLGGGVLVLPLALILAWRKGFPGGGRGFPLLLFLGLALPLLLLAVARYRFGPAFALPAGLGGALLLWRGASWGRMGGWGRKALAAAGAGAVAAAFLLPAGELARAKLANPWHDIEVGAAPTMAWLARNTPAPSDPYDPAQPPAYGVLAFWDLGHAVVSRGLRPAPASGFFDTLPGPPFRDSMALLLEEDPGRLKGAMKERRLRYLVLGHAPREVQAASRYLGPLAEERYRDAVAGRPGPVPTPVVLSLSRERGSATTDGETGFPGCRHFRLLFEDWRFYSPTREIERYQVFEVVEGARLRGRAAPGSAVLAALALDFPGGAAAGGEEFWQEAGAADEEGRFELVVPYPSESASGETRPRGPWQVSIEGEPAPRAVLVTEEQVLRGLPVEVR